MCVCVLSRHFRRTVAARSSFCRGRCSHYDFALTLCSQRVADLASAAVALWLSLWSQTLLAVLPEDSFFVVFFKLALDC